MRKRSLLAISLVFLAACSNEGAAIESYFLETEEITTSLSEVAGKFETLMNVQANMLAWTEAEKNELTAVQDAIDQLSADAEQIAVPPVLVDVHPLLLEAIAEMRDVVNIVSDIAENPSLATEEAATDLEEKGANVEMLTNEYVEQLEEKLGEEYPEFFEE